MNKITPEARHRRQRESLQEQLIQIKDQITVLLERRRKIDWAIKLHDECQAQGINLGDQSDIDFHLNNEK